MNKYFQGTGQILKLIFRQDRFKMTVWLLCLIAITVTVAYAYPDVYKTERDITGFVLTMQNPAMEAMLGPVYDADTRLVAAIFAHEMLLFTAIAVAIMNILLIGRSTRTDEEDGRLELLQSLPVGRLSHITAVMLEAVILNLILVIFIGTGLSAVGLEGMTVEASFLYGSILGSAGFFFASVTALFAQLAKTSRGTIGLSFAVLIVSYIVRAIGDVESETLSLLSPLGWTVRSGVFIDNKWWPVLISLAAGIILSVLVFYLNQIRDLGGGFIPEMKGRTHASALLKTPLGFVFRMQRTNIMAWAVGMFLLSAAFGAILGDMEKYYSSMELLQAFLSSSPGHTFMEQFMAVLIVILTIFGAIPAVMSVLKLKSEENKNRTESIYSCPVSRTGVLASYVTAAVIVSIIMMLATALGLWSTSTAVLDETITLGKMLKSVLVYLPAIWIMISIGVFLIGFFPRAASAVWLYVVFCFVVVYLGDLLKFPEWLMNISSFTHVPRLFVEEGGVPALAVMTVLSVIITLCGFIGYRRRDITG